MKLQVDRLSDSVSVKLIALFFSEIKLLSKYTEIVSEKIVIFHREKSYLYVIYPQASGSRMSACSNTRSKLALEMPSSVCYSLHSTGMIKTGFKRATRLHDVELR